MWVVSRKRLVLFWSRHPDSETRLRWWYSIVKNADWRSFADVRSTFPSADLVGRLVVFNVGGDNYRIIALVNFDTHKVFIRSILTHREYDTDVWKQDPWNR